MQPHLAQPPLSEASKPHSQTHSSNPPLQPHLAQPPLCEASKPHSQTDSQPEDDFESYSSTKDSYPGHKLVSLESGEKFDLKEGDDNDNNNNSNSNSDERRIDGSQGSKSQEIAQESNTQESKSQETNSQETKPQNNVGKDGNSTDCDLNSLDSF